MTTTDILADQDARATHRVPVGEDHSIRNGHIGLDTQKNYAVAGFTFSDDYNQRDTQRAIVVGDSQQLNGHCASGIHSPVAVEPLTSQPPKGHTTTKDVAAVGTLTGNGQMTGGHQPAPAAAPNTSPLASSVTTPNDVSPVVTTLDRSDPANDSTAPRRASPDLADPLLALAADVLDDLERVRIANENRLRQLTRDETDKDGEERGFGLTVDHPDVARLAALVDALAKAEHDATLNLQRMVRRHPLGPWIKQSKGIGEKQGARLLAAIGDPYWNTLYDRPRTVSELWAYCGYHVLSVGHNTIDTHMVVASGGLTGSNPNQSLPVDTQTTSVGVAATRARGHRANWSADAKMRARLISESIVKAGGPYREVYDAGRSKYADALHRVECKRCGPTGKPALPGSPLSDGHKHARALRLVSKTVLRDLWREAKRLHEFPPAATCVAIPNHVPPLGETHSGGES